MIDKFKRVGERDGVVAKLQAEAAKKTMREQTANFKIKFATHRLLPLEKRFKRPIVNAVCKAAAIEIVLDDVKRGIRRHRVHRRVRDERDQAARALIVRAATCSCKRRQLLQEKEVKTHRQAPTRR